MSADKYSDCSDEEDWIKAVDQAKRLHLTEYTLEIKDIDWNDEYFVDRILTPCALQKTVSHADARLYAKAFLNWYTSGEDNCEIGNVWIGLVCGIRIPKEDSVLVSPPIAETGKQLQAPLDPVILDGFKVCSESKEPNFKKWYYRVREYLDHTEGSEMAGLLTDKNQDAINYLGFIAMSMLRAIEIDDEPDLSQHISLNSSKQFAKFWPHSSFDRSSLTPVPNTKALFQFKSKFNRYSEHCTRAMAILINAYRGQMDTDATFLRRRILKAACLNDLAERALGIFHLTVRASAAIEQHPVDLISYAELKKHTQTNQTIMNMLLNFAHKNSGEVTWPWAMWFRLLAFPGLSIVEYPNYAGIMVGILAGHDEAHTMWNRAEFRSVRHQDKQFVRNSCAIAKEICEWSAKRIAQEAEQQRHIDYGLGRSVPSTNCVVKAEL